ncbi:MAG: HD domain-containing protein [Anaerolineales bacterium]
MLTKEELERIADYTRQYLYETGAKRDEERIKRQPRSSEHRWQHTLNVLRNAEQILAGENASDELADIVRVAVLMHDISKFTCESKIHAQVGAEVAQKYLTEQGYPKEFVERVALAIAEHGKDFSLIPHEQQGELLSWEGKVLIEADVLDKLGASAITDALLSLGKRDRLGFETRAELQGRPMQRAVSSREYFWTNTGKRMAEGRFAFFEKFMEQLADEVVEVSSL